MKNRWLSAAACGALAAVMALSFSACESGEGASGSFQTASISAGASGQENLSVSDASGIAETSSAINKFASMEAYADSGMMKAMYSGLIENLAADNVDLSITGEDNRLVFTYTYNNFINSDEPVEMLSSNLDAQESSFQSMAASLKQFVEVENPVVVIVALDQNGEEMFTREFTEE